jgi:hypothetical protein
MATLLYNQLIEDIRATTKDPTYHLHKVGEEYTLRRETATTTVSLSAAYTARDIGLWLHAYLEGLHVGTLTAKRGN